MKKVHVKRDDTVIVISGDDKGVIKPGFNSM